MANGNKINEMARDTKFFRMDALIRGIMLKIK